MAWARPDNLHSRLVFWFKLLLPLSALAILSTLFMVSRTIRPEDAIPYSNIDIAKLLNEPRLTSPDFAGMTADGAALSLKADQALLGQSGTFRLGPINGLVGLLETPGGGHTDLTAREARLDATGRMMLLSGDVTINNSAGYHIVTQHLAVALDQTSLDSKGPIMATGPVGSLEAGSLHLGLAATGAKTYVLDFRDGVRMIYLPTKQGTEN